MGAPTITSITPADGCHEPRGRILRLPRTAIGTIGKPVSRASMNPPFLKGRSGWSADRVPSGKITTDTPDAILVRAARRLATAWS